MVEKFYLVVGNACTLVPTIFRWHGKREFKWNFHFSFSHDIEKQIWVLLFVFHFRPNFEKRFCTSYFVFRFRITLKNGYQFQFSFFVFASLWKTDMNFVFRFRITLKNGFEFRFSFSHHFEKQIWISSVIFAWLEKQITAPGQSFEAPATPSGLTGAFMNFPLPGDKLRSKLRKSKLHFSMLNDNLFAVNQIYTEKFAINNSLERFQFSVGV